jgi:putative two-component system response regulator
VSITEIEMYLDIKSAKILVVDDELHNLALINETLSLNGYKHVTTTQEPEKVVQLFESDNFDLIVLDINMPALDGFAVMEKLKQNENIEIPPILILTAQHMQDTMLRALESGARDYVTKPFNVNEFLLRVQNLLEVQMAHKYMLNQNEILEQRVRERTQAIHDTRLKVVRQLGRAAEYRDNETGLHIVRMSKIAVLLAKAVGVDDSQCELMLHAVPMHDIGKIGIPDHILLKPGKLDLDEFEIMKTHVQIGADILSGDSSDLMMMAHKIALTHHEKWNGQGYPNSLKGEEIPLIGRIAALADVFDALTSERAYKKSWPIDDAVTYIKDQRGLNFDPVLVDLFIQNIEEIKKIKREFEEPVI